jgi:hypothetical protein
MRYVIIRCNLATQISEGRIFGNFAVIAGNTAGVLGNSPIPAPHTVHARDGRLGSR